MPDKLTREQEREQERELLQLRSQLAQLKLKAAHRTRRQRQHHSAPADTVLNFANNLSGVVGNRKLLKLALLPSRWKYRLLLGGALLAWEYYKNSHSQPTPIRRRNYNDGNFIEAERDFNRLPDKS